MSRTPSPTKKSVPLTLGMGSESNSLDIVEKALANSQHEKKTKLHQAMLTPRTARDITDWISKDQSPSPTRESKMSTLKTFTAVKQPQTVSMEENIPIGQTPVGSHPTTTPFSRFVHGLGAALDSIGLKNRNLVPNHNQANLNAKADVVVPGKTQSPATDSLLSLEKLNQLLSNHCRKETDRRCLQPLPLNRQANPCAPPNSPERMQDGGDSIVTLPEVELESSTLVRNSPNSPFRALPVSRPPIPTVWKRKKELSPNSNTGQDNGESSHAVAQLGVPTGSAFKSVFASCHGIPIDALDSEKPFPLRAWEYKQIKSHFDLYRPSTLRYPPDGFPLESSPVFSVGNPANTLELTSIWRHLSIGQSEEIYRWIKIFEDVFYLTVRFLLKATTEGHDIDGDFWAGGKLWKELQWPQGFFVEHMKECYNDEFGQPSFFTTDEDLTNFLNTRDIFCSITPSPRLGTYGKLKDLSGSVCYMTSVGYGSTEDTLDIRRFGRHIILSEQCRKATIGQLYQLEPKIWDPHQEYSILEDRTTYSLNPPVPWLKWDHSRKMFTGVVPTKDKALQLGEQRYGTNIITGIHSDGSYYIRLCIQAFSFDTLPLDLIFEQTIKAELIMFVVPSNLSSEVDSRRNILSVPTNEEDSRLSLFQQLDSRDIDPFYGKFESAGLEDPLETPQQAEFGKSMTPTNNTEETCYDTSDYFEIAETGGFNLEQCIVAPIETLREYRSLGVVDSCYGKNKLNDYRPPKHIDEVESSETELSDYDTYLLQHIPYVKSYRRGFWDDSRIHPKGKALRPSTPPQKAINPRNKTNEGGLNSVEAILYAYDKINIEQAPAMLTEQPRSETRLASNLSNYSSPFEDFPDILPTQPRRKFTATLTNMLEEYAKNYEDKEIDEDHDLLPPPLSSPNDKVGISKQEDIVFSLRESVPKKGEQGDWGLNDNSDKENWNPCGKDNRQKKGTNSTKIRWSPMKLV